MGERYPTADKHKAVMSAHTPLADATAFFHALCAHGLALTV